MTPSQPSPKFARKSTRVPFESDIVVTMKDGTTVLGKIVDLSRGGTGIEIPFKPEPGEQVQLFLDRPGKNRGWTAATVQGKVAWSMPLDRDAGEEGPWYRVGIELALTVVTARWLSELLGPGYEVGHRSLGADPVRPACPEALYHAVLDAIDDGAFECARDIVRTALRRAPRASDLRALQMRIEAELALAEKRFEDANRRIEQGRRYAPAQPCWDGLAGRATRPRSTGLLARLFASS